MSTPSVREDLRARASDSIARARTNFDVFAEIVGVDQDGDPLQQHVLHRFIWAFERWCYARDLYAGIMCPAGHGKTTQVCLRAASAVGEDENVLCRVVTSSENGANERAGAIRDFMAQPNYKAVFPGVKVEKGLHGETEFTVRRTGVSKDPTLGCSGVQTGTGARVTLLILDDICDTRNTILNPADRKKVYVALREIWMSRPNAIGNKKPRVVWIQTAYHFQDAAALTQQDPDSGWAWLIVRAEEPFEHLTFEIMVGGEVVKRGTIPNVFSPEELRRRSKRMGRVAAARALGNRPMADGEQKFDATQFNGPRPLNPDRYTRLVSFCDSAGDPKKAKRGDTDYAAMVTIGQHPTDGCWDLVDSRRMRGRPNAQAEFFAKGAIELGINSIYVESVSDGAMPALVQNKLAALGHALPVQSEKPLKNKEVRITEEIEPRLSQGMLRVHGRSHRELVSEALQFPMGAHDDLIDALAGACMKAIIRGHARHRRPTVRRPEGASSRSRGNLRAKRAKMWGR